MVGKSRSSRPYRIALALLAGAALVAVAAALWSRGPQGRGERPESPVEIVVVSPVPEAAAAAAEIIVDARAGIPAAVTVCVGERVIWRNRSPDAVIITARDRSFSSGLVSPGSDYEFFFAVPGTFQVDVEGYGHLGYTEVEVVRCAE